MTTPEEHLTALISKYIELKDKKWNEGRFRHIKALSTTEKGNIAEDLAIWLGEHGGFKVERHASKRGEWDVKIHDIKMEVKAATEEVNGCFQFNGIRYDTKYDRLLVIGVAPDRVLFNIYPRRDLADLSLVRMAKGANATDKLTRKPVQLLGLDAFTDRILGNSTI